MTYLIILADLRNVVVWIISVRLLVSSSFSNSLGIVPSRPTTTSITVTFMFLCFFSSLARSKYLFICSLSLIFILWSVGTEKSTRRHFFLFFFYFVFLFWLCFCFVGFFWFYFVLFLLFFVFFLLFFAFVFLFFHFLFFLFFSFFLFFGVFLLIGNRSGLLTSIRWSFSISKFLRILWISFSRRRRFWFVYILSNFDLLHNC